MTTTQTTDQVGNKKVQIANGTTPSGDRFVSLTTHRLLARTVYVVGVVDGTGRLADDKSLMVTPDYERARRHANKLVQAAGGKCEPQDHAVHLPKPSHILKVRGTEPRAARRPLVSVEPPRETRDCRYLVRWRRENRRANGRRFDTEPEANEFYNRLRQEMA